MRYLIAVVFVLLAAQCLADPVWATAEIVEELTVYRDHRDAGHYYYEPATYQVTTKDGEPQVFYRLFRYMGTTETRDSNEFRVSAILTIDVEQTVVADRYMPALSILRGRNPSARLSPLPVDGFSAGLNYVAIKPDGEEQSGLVDALGTGDGEEGPGNSELQYWSKRRFTLAFDPLTAQLFWDNFENDRLQLSLSHSLMSAGMRKNNEGLWELDERRFGNSVPIHISMKEHANHFSRTEAWQLANRRRTDVIVMCYDFFEEDANDLYRVSIEVRFKTMRDQDYVEKVRFESDGDDAEQTVSFRLARSMDEPYLYRVTRIFRSKPTEQSDWIEHRGLLLDVTSYAM